MKGQLEQRSVSAVVHSECGHCGRPMEIETDGCTRATPREGDPRVVAPMVNLRRLREKNIIERF